MAYKKTFKRKVNKFVKKVGTAAKKRYFTGGKVGIRNVKLNQVASDVSKLKYLLNVEKKVIIREVREPIPFALIVNPNKSTATHVGEAIYSQRAYTHRSGAYIIPNLVGVISRGTDKNQLVGDRCKVVSFHMDFRIKAIEGTLASAHWQKQKTSVRLILALIPRADQVLVGGSNYEETLLNKFYDKSVFDETIDGTKRNITHMKDFKIIQQRSWNFFHNDNNDGNTPSTKYDGIWQSKFGGKTEFHLRFEGDELVKNQLCLMAIADSGEIHNVPSADNHYTLEYSTSIYYVDN